MNSPVVVGVIGLVVLLVVIALVIKLVKSVIKWGLVVLLIAGGIALYKSGKWKDLLPEPQHNSTRTMPTEPQ